MNLYLVRHAILCKENQNRYNGHNDISLCDEGREMAKRLAAELDEMEFDAVFCSDLTRAKETLAPSKHAKNAIYTPALREKSWGKHEGMSFDEIVASGLEYGDFRSWIDSLDGESVLELRERVTRFLEALTHNNILVVTHAGVIATLLSIVNNITIQEAFSEKIEHCKIIKL
jgi:broad specificity phosphatase PhoE